MTTSATRMRILRIKKMDGLKKYFFQLFFLNRKKIRVFLSKKKFSKILGIFLVFFCIFHQEFFMKNFKGNFITYFDVLRSYEQLLSKQILFFFNILKKIKHF